MSEPLAVMWAGRGGVKEVEVLDLGKIVVGLLVVLVAVFIFVPGVRQSFTRVLSNSETVVVPPRPDGGAQSAQSQSNQGEVVEQELEIITLLGYDAIPAIVAPDFLSAGEAQLQYSPDEQVLGLSINGDNRAYSIPMLSRHEIVNDEVGGVPVAVTW
ncbi:MAG: DUF3179 domain-containing protein [Chloroflexi bacterium]|nr:DUF3179 domain-containing protein [Chloroflexota bacterium]MCI0813259.1 DUF3179 domain-containing protein [Chloroflexota bacterium]MCI0869340.1 DUF3179 domain-containing protein [Chloroflexota bacterium]